MRVAVFSSHPHDETYLNGANKEAGHDLVFLESRLKPHTAKLADGFDAVCAFVNDDLGEEVLEVLAGLGIEHIALRSAGFNHVDLAGAERLGFTVARVPAYSPHAVAEHTVAIMLALNRQIHKAYTRVRDGNFALDGLLGFDLHGRTVGVIGTGKIGERVAVIMSGFGCRIVAYDPHPNQVCLDLGVEYVDLPTLFGVSDIVTLHTPLTPETHHLINDKTVEMMKPGVMIVNTSRGALVDTVAVIDGLKSGRVGYLGLDVYEEEGDLFFENLSDRIITDDVFSRLLTFPNVIITGHQGFFTADAITAIAETTIENLTAFEAGTTSGNELDLGR
ncbi:MAG: 2-hydroxyacid dehydrogenase [Acidimicrobiia bacterium]|nr:2-hydroxyacid dehydrogenase [Acidimicrobiia bacterium]MBT8217772.1 2-hydroxyacid dehydrogenase [Acidimicrobiia bacterium]NNF10314.1 2-hydroxyacid dehydrogenase [Acidimicrobiia bacterium]NNL68826.1 2-hydroxyacid dehydrogenase [Acidimicrobiia bacterium]